MKNKILESLISAQASTIAGSVSRFFPITEDTFVNRLIDGSLFNIFGHVYLAKIPQSDYSMNIANNFLYRGFFQTTKASSNIITKNEIKDQFPQFEGLAKEFILTFLGLEVFFAVNAIEGMILNDYHKWLFIFSTQGILAGDVYYNSESWNNTKWTTPKVLKGVVGVVSSFYVVDLLHYYAEDSVIMNLDKILDITLVSSTSIAITAGNVAYQTSSKLDSNSSSYDFAWSVFDAGSKSIAADLIKIVAFVTARVTAPIVVKFIVPYVVASMPTIIETFVFSAMLEVIDIELLEIPGRLFDVTDFNMDMIGQTYDADQS